MFNQRGSKFGAVTGVLRSPHARSGSRTLTASHSGRCATGRLRHALRAGGLLLVLALLVLEGAGCKNWFKPVEWPELGPQSKEPKSPFRLVAKKSMSTVSLAPEDIVRIMQRVGFEDKQVLDLGTDLHNALRFSGAAEVFHYKQKLAIFVADGGLVRIRSRVGSFDYEVANHQFVSGVQTDQ